MQQDPSDEIIAKLVLAFEKKLYSDALCEASKLLEKYENSVFLNNFIGVIHDILGNSDLAILHLKEALRIDHSFADGHFNLGNFYHKLGKLAEAAECFQRALAIVPDHINARNNLGISFNSMGDFRKAIKSFLEVVKIHPKNSAAYANLSTSYIAITEYEKAIECASTAIQLDPQNLEALNNLGLAMSEKDDFVGAIDCYKEVLRINPNAILTLNNLMIAYNGLNDKQNAIEVGERVIALDPSTDRGFLNLGLIYSDIDLRKAINCYQEALSITSDRTGVFCRIADLYEAWNELDKLEAWLESTATVSFKQQEQIQLRCAKLYFRKKQYQKAFDILSVISIESLEQIEQIAYLEIKGKTEEKLELYESAFDSYALMNQTTFNAFPSIKSLADSYYQKHEEKLLIIKESKTADLPPSNINKSTVNFIVGFPRSGTTLLDTLLRSHSEINIVEEKPILENTLRKLDFEPTEVLGSKIPTEDQRRLFQNTYNAELVKQFNHIMPNGVCIDKMPLNIFYASDINYIWPNAKFILAIRHPLDCILSCYFQNFKLNPAMGNMLLLERIFNMYNLSMHHIFSAREKLGLDVHIIKYEELITNNRTELTKVVKFLDISWEESMMLQTSRTQISGRITTPSYWQVAQPIYTSSIGRWRFHWERLKIWVPIVQDWIDKFEYDTDLSALN